MDFRDDFNRLHAFSFTVNWYFPLSLFLYACPDLLPKEGRDFPPLEYINCQEIAIWFSPHYPFPFEFVRHLCGTHTAVWQYGGLSASKTV